jgi:transposase InsO family protein
MPHRTFKKNGRDLEKVRGKRVKLSQRIEVTEQIVEASTNGCRISQSCKVIGLDKRTFERWRHRPEGDLRKGPLTEPANKLTNDERLEILQVSSSIEFRDKPPSQIVPELADQGVYLASESSFYRVLQANKLMKHRGRPKPACRAKPEALVATAPNQIYSWDITYLKAYIKGVFHYLYLFMDVYSRKIVGFSVEDEQCNTIAAQIIETTYQSEKLVSRQVVLHSDNGGPMKGATMLATLQKLGVVPSFSRPSVSDDNPFSEALFRTLKYCPEYPTEAFESLDDAKDWVQKFVKWYNEEHKHSGIKFVTPSQRHSGQEVVILKNRKDLYEKAKSKNPNRWSKETRNWNPIEKVYLNNLQKNNKSGNGI